MNHPLFSLFLFLLVVFVYIHIIAQWKKSEDLEIYEMDYVNGSQLHEVCSVKQPVMFEFIHNPEFYHRIQHSKMEKFDNYDIKLKDTRDYWNPVVTDTTTVDYVVLPYHSGKKLMDTDTNSRYISENNSEFLEVTGLEYICSSMDTFLKPPINMYSKYDLLIGSKHATTPMRYHTNASYFVVPTSGKIRVKMTPWKSSRYLHQVKDYEQYEFRSRVNVWNPSPSHMNEMDKLRFLDFEVQKGYILSIPPYWWYSIRYSTDPDTCVCAFTYDTVINALAHSYDWGMYYLQQSNISNTFTKARENEDTEIALSLDGVTEPPRPAEPIINKTVENVKYSGRDETQVPMAHAFRPLEHASKEGVRGNSRERRNACHNGTCVSAIGSSSEFGVKMEIIEDGPLTTIPAIIPPPPPPSEKKEIITNAGIYQVA